MERFSYEVNGYNRDEVNKFVENVIAQTEEFVSKYKIQQKKIESLNQELEHYRKIESSLKDAIIRAEDTSNHIKKMAREEADIIITDAKHNASRIVNESLLKAEKIEMKCEYIENNMKIFKRKLKLIMEQQMAVVEEIEVLELDNNK